MSISSASSPFSSGYSMPMQGSSSLMPTAGASSLLGSQSQTGGMDPSSLMGGTSMGGGDSMSMLLQIMQMMMTMMMTLMQGLMGGGAGMGSGSDPSSAGSAGDAGSAGSGMQALAATAPSPGGSPSPAPSSDSQYLPTAESGYTMGNPNGTPPSPSASPAPSSYGAIGNGAGWNNNVNVFASSAPDQETWESDSSGYLTDLEKGMDSGETLTQAHDGVHLAQDPMRNNANPNSLVKGGGGNAVIVTGDGYDQDGAHANALANSLRKDYGMNVKIIPDSSPNQLRAALQQMGQQTGQQAVVAVLAHGARDTSGKNDGDIALGKGDGDQWLHESDLKSMVNQYLAPNYKNVNVVLNSCYSGQFVD